MRKIIQIIKNHKWAILLALIAAGIIASPQIYLRYDNQNVYQGIEVIGTGDEEAWLSRVRETYDGYPTMSNAYFKEGKNDPYLYQPLGSNIAAFWGRLFSLDINNTVLFSRLLFSFILFLLIYGFSLSLLKAKSSLTALATASFLLLANSLFARQALFKVFTGHSPSITYLNYTRPINPMMTHLFFFGFLFCFWLFWQKKQKRWGILSALLLGLSFYDYFYTWTFLYSFLGILAIISLFQKKWLEIKKIMMVLAGATLLAVPYFFNFYRVVNWPTYLEVGQRLGMLEGRFFHLGILAPLLLAVFLLFFPRQWKERYYFSLALVIAPFIVLNQQIITSKVLSSDHYHWYFHLPLAVFFSLMIFFFLLAKTNWQALKKISAVLIILVSILTGVWIQKSSYAANKEKIVESQRYGPVMAWLSQNAEKDDVVFSDYKTAEFIVVYTPLNVFYHGSAKYSLAATHGRLVDAVFLYYRLDGLNEEKAREVFFHDREGLTGRIYGIYYRDTSGGAKNMPDELLLELIEQYQESFVLSASEFFKGMLDKYQVEYLVWDRQNNPLWQLSQYLFLAKKAEINDFIIYQKI